MELNNEGQIEIDESALPTSDESESGAVVLSINERTTSIDESGMDDAPVTNNDASPTDTTGADADQTFESAIDVTKHSDNGLNNANNDDTNAVCFHFCFVVFFTLSLSLFHYRFIFLIVLFVAF